MTIDPDAFNAFEAAGWERSAAGYDEFFAPITGRVVETLLDVAEVGSGTRLLDLATGPSYVAGRAVARGADVVGVDVSDAMLQIARRRISSARFERGDIEELSFADASFDAVVGNFAILHVGRPEQVAAEAVRVLAHGGRLAFTAWLPEHARILGVFVDAVASVGAAPPEDIPVGPNFFRFSDDDEFAALLRGASIEPVVRADAGVRRSAPGCAVGGTARRDCAARARPRPAGG